MDREPWTESPEMRGRNSRSRCLVGLGADAETDDQFARTVNVPISLVCWNAVTRSAEG